MSELLDARGVKIEAGDTVIFGFSVGRSVGMAEGEVVNDGSTVSLTASGRVRVRIIRRSYGGGTKPVVDIAPDRLVVLKRARKGFRGAVLPPSPLPTQAEEYRQRLKDIIEIYTEDLKSRKVPDSWWMHNPGLTLADYHDWCRQQIDKFITELNSIT